MLACLQQSLQICQAIGDIPGLCPALFNMTIIYLEYEKPQAAAFLFTLSYKIASVIHYAEVLQALEKRAKTFKGEGLAHWKLCYKAYLKI